jgi:hypothetical protein
MFYVVVILGEVAVSFFAARRLPLKWSFVLLGP